MYPLQDPRSFSFRSPIAAACRTGLPAVLILAVAIATSEAEWPDLSGHAANLVLGQDDFTSDAVSTTATGMRRPHAIVIDPVTKKVFVSDAAHHRVTRFASAEALQNGDPAEAVLGQPNLNSAAIIDPPTAASMQSPKGLFLDAQGRLWVADSNNHRVLRFDNALAKANGANADGVLGQANFTSNDFNVPGLSAATLRCPESLLMDSAGNLWVADTLNDRVLRYNNAAAKVNGANADAVLGQANFTSIVFGVSTTLMRGPGGLALNPDGNTLWVCDSANSRILRFDNVLAKPNGGGADGILGQSDFVSGDIGRSASRLDFPLGLFLDDEGALWVVDSGNHRVVRFDNVAAKANGADADDVLGQLDFLSGFPGLTASKFESPTGIFVEENCEAVWVTDRGHSRVLRFGNAPPAGNRFQPDGWIGTKAAAQKGDDIHNPTGAAQTINVKMPGNRAGKFFFTVQNDGDAVDDFLLRATKGNAKLKVRYFSTPGRNITAAIIKGRHRIVGLAPGALSRFKGKTKATPRSRDRRAARKLTITATSQANASIDTIKAKIKKTP